MSGGPYTEHDLVALLAPTLGDERARELVRGALGTLNLSEGRFPSQDAVRVLELIGGSAGFVGSVARFALARFTLNDATAVAAGPPSSRGGESEGGTETLSRSEVTSLLAPALGEEKSEEAVSEALRKHGLPRDALSITQALAVLGELSLADGLVGVAARFAKARVLMRARKS